MATSQKNTSGIKKTDSDFVAIPYTELNYIQRAYVDYKSVSGLVTDDDGIRKMTVDELAKMLHIDRRTVYANRDMVPNFWDLVAERRQELAGREQLAEMYKIWRLKAMGNGPSSFQYFQLWQANFNPHFRMPTEKKEIEIDMGDNLTALMLQAVKKDIIASEVIDVRPTDETAETRSSSQDIQDKPSA